MSIFETVHYKKAIQRNDCSSIESCYYAEYSSVGYIECFPDLAFPTANIRELCAIINNSQIGDCLELSGTTWEINNAPVFIELTDRFLTSLAWCIVESETLMISRRDKPQTEIRKEILELHGRWAKGNYPFQWKRS